MHIDIWKLCRRRTSFQCGRISSSFCTSSTPGPHPGNAGSLSPLPSCPAVWESKAPLETSQPHQQAIWGCSGWKPQATLTTQTLPHPWNSSCPVRPPHASSFSWFKIHWRVETNFITQLFQQLIFKIQKSEGYNIHIFCILALHEFVQNVRETKFQNKCFKLKISGSHKAQSI